MKLIPLLLCLSVLTQCRQKETSEAGQQETTSTTLSPKAYEDSLALYLYTPERNKWALDLFANHVDKANAEQVDLALKAFLAFQSALIDTLNNNLYKLPDYEAISTLIYDDANRKPEGLAFEKKMNQNALLVKTSEGAVYLDRDAPQLLTYFGNYVTPAMKEYLGQFIAEEQQELSEDAAIVIPISDLANRLVFWDEFIAKYPQHIFAQTATSKRDVYLLFLLTGLDNTPSFDFESKKINKDYMDAYTMILSTHPNMPSAKVINEFVELLKKNNYTHTATVDEFLIKYQPFE